MFFKIKKLSQIVILGLFGFLFSSFALSATSNVVGNWKTIDSKTQKPSSIIAIRPAGSIFVGKIIKTFDGTSEKKVERCTLCKDDRKNQSIIGLEIIRHMQCQPNDCRGGTILDPRDGKIYKATMRLINNGQQLKVRGYIGVSLFGKTVVWNRVIKK